MTQGDPRQAQALCDRFKAPFPCLADPQRAGYRAYGLPRGGPMELLGPQVIARGVEAAAKGHFIERTIGDRLQLSGTFIIDRAGVVRYARYARHSADHPKTSELISALRAVQAEPSGDGR